MCDSDYETTVEMKWLRLAKTKQLVLLSFTRIKSSMELISFDKFGPRTVLAVVTMDMEVLFLLPNPPIPICTYIINILLTYCFVSTWESLTMSSLLAAQWCFWYTTSKNLFVLRDIRNYCTKLYARWPLSSPLLPLIAFFIYFVFFFLLWIGIIKCIEQIGSWIRSHTSLFGNTWRPPNAGLFSVWRHIQFD